MEQSSVEWLSGHPDIPEIDQICGQIKEVAKVTIKNYSKKTFVCVSVHQSDLADVRQVSSQWRWWRLRPRWLPRGHEEVINVRPRKEGRERWSSCLVSPRDGPYRPRFKGGLGGGPTPQPLDGSLKETPSSASLAREYSSRRIYTGFWFPSSWFLKRVWERRNQ